MIVDSTKKQGYGVVKKLFDTNLLDSLRALIIKHIHLFENTRSYSASRHLPSFHIYKSLSSLMALSQNPDIKILLNSVLGDYKFLNFSDITINRSQPWHKDLLRGKYTKIYEGKKTICSDFHDHVYKLLFYLQDQSSLKIIKNSHIEDIDLHSDEFAQPNTSDEIIKINSKKGDAILLDICSTHAGSNDDECSSLDLFDQGNTKILITFVFGKTDSWLSGVMEEGNQARLIDWNKKYKKIIV